MLQKETSFKTHLDDTLILVRLKVAIGIKQEDRGSLLCMRKKSSNVRRYVKRETQEI